MTYVYDDVTVLMAAYKAGGESTTQSMFFVYMLLSGAAFLGLVAAALFNRYLSKP